MAEAVRTPTYQRRAKRLLSEEELVRLETSIAERPQAHPVVPGTGGVRKARWARPGKGKRSGVRVAYFFLVRADIVYMLDIYAKNEKADLTPSERRALKAIARQLEES